jgi:hypothetical protein
VLRQRKILHFNEVIPLYNLKQHDSTLKFYSAFSLTEITKEKAEKAQFIRGFSLGLLFRGPFNDAVNISDCNASNDTATY